MGSFKFLLELVKGPATAMIAEYHRFDPAHHNNEELLEKAGFDIQEKARV